MSRRGNRNFSNGRNWRHASGAVIFISRGNFLCDGDRQTSREKYSSTRQIARTTILRGAEILGLGLLFRVQEFVLGFRGAPWTDLLRVDVLNIIGLSMMLMGVLCWVLSIASGSADLAAVRIRNAIASAATALAIALVTPPMWTTWRPRWLPWFLESYINGVHIYNKPQPWLFPLFPWAGFAFAGLAAGFVLMMPAARKHELRVVAYLAAAGAAIYAIAQWADSQPRQIYSEYDFWHTSPNFFLIRLAILLGIMLFAYVWCQWGLPSRVFSPLVQLGQTSLLVYWVHIEFVYGGMSILTRHSQTIASASVGLAIIFVAMLILSILRTKYKGRGAEIFRKFAGTRRGLERTSN